LLRFDTFRRLILDILPHWRRSRRSRAGYVVSAGCRFPLKIHASYIFLVVGAESMGSLPRCIEPIPCNLRAAGNVHWVPFRNKLPHSAYCREMTAFSRCATHSAILPLPQLHLTANTGAYARVRFFSRLANRVGNT
jgi:hypothetical protein